MAGERVFEKGSAARGVPPAAGRVPGWDLDVDEPEDWEYLSRDYDELGLVDPMSPEEFEALCSGNVRWVQPPRFDPALFEPLPGTEDVCRCMCGHAHRAPSTGQEPPADGEAAAERAATEGETADGEPTAEGAAAGGAEAADDGADDAAAAAGGAAAGGDPSDQAGLPSPEAAMAQIRLERAAEVLDALEALEAAQARLDADRVLLLAALTRAEGGEAPVAMLDAPAVAASETAAALRIAQRTARAMVEEALALTHPAMAPVLAAMRAGRLTRRRAAIVLDAALPVPAARLEDFAHAAAAIAAPDDPDRTPTPGALGRRLRRLAEDYADEPLKARKAKALADRRVDLEPAGDGMCHLTALIPLETGALIDTRLNAIARALQSPEEARTVNQLRADILTDLLLGNKTGLPAGGVRTELVVTVPAATLAGASDTPGEILGYGPIDPEAARRLAAETTTWTRLTVHPLTGAPLAIGRVRYAPTAAMRRFLALRDATCRFPGCDKPVAATEADHTHEWAQGGETDVDNLALLCPEHHRLKTLGYWTVRHIGTEQTTGLEAQKTTGQETVQQTRPDRQQDTGQEPTTPPTAHPAQDRGERPGQATRSGPDSQPGHATPSGPAHAPEPAPPESPLPPGTLEWTAPSGRKHRTYSHSDPPPPF